MYADPHIPKAFGINQVETLVSNKTPLTKVCLGDMVHMRTMNIILVTDTQTDNIIR